MTRQPPPRFTPPLMLLLGALLLVPGCGGEEAPEAPTAPAPRGPAPGEETAPPEVAPSPPVTEAGGVELLVRATDALPLRLQPRPAPGLAEQLRWRRTAPGGLALSPDLARAITEGQTDGTLRIGDGIHGPADVGAVVIERITYDGEGRQGSRTRVILGTTLEALPAPTTPDQFTLGLSDPVTRLYEALPWPDGLAWRLTDAGDLEVTGARTWTLKKGATRDLPPAAAEIPVRITGHAPAEKGAPGADSPEVQEADLGPIRFRSALTVRYHGRLPVTEAR